MNAKRGYVPEDERNFSLAALEIEYRDTHDFTKDELECLFLSVNWSSGHFPDKLLAMCLNQRNRLRARGYRTKQLNCLLHL